MRETSQGPAPEEDVIGTLLRPAEEAPEPPPPTPISTAEVDLSVVDSLLERPKGDVESGR
jgi:hypothetical protein